MVQRPGYFYFSLLLLYVAVLFSGCSTFKKKQSSFGEGSFKYDTSVGKIELNEVFISVKDTVYTSADTFYVAKNYFVSTFDTIHTYKDITLGPGGHIYFHDRDSLVTIKDSLVTSVDTLYRLDEMMLLKLEEYVQRDNYVAKLLKNFVKFEKKVEEKDEEPVEQSDAQYEKYNDRIIRSIDIKVLDAFGPSISDPEGEPKNILEQAGNLFHVRSRKWLISNTLLFKEGDKINSFLISENERLLRQNDYTFDSKIEVLNYNEDNDSVDVLVIVQDIWSISAGANYDPPMQGGTVSLGDANFLGTGTTVSNSLMLSPLIASKYNYTGNFRVNNIYNTFFAGHAHYMMENGIKRYGFSLNRDFISPAIKWAGGVNCFWQEVGHYPLPWDENPDRIYMNQQEAWIGYSDKLFDNENKKYKGNRWVTAIKYVRTEHTVAPPDLFNSHQILGSLGYINTRFFKDRYIFRFGRTEDIPEGDLIALVAGVDQGFARLRRPYLGLNTAWSRFNSSLGYLYGNFMIGGFRNGADWEQGAIQTRLMYFTPIIRIKRWMSRFYLGLRYTEGINQLPGIYLNINNEDGIRGLKAHDLLGTKKAVINFEVNLFPPLNFFGFNTALVLFTDFAWIGEDGMLFKQEHVQSGMGIGLRFRNEHLIFGTIQFLLGYYPHAPNVGREEFQLFERSRFFYNFNQFQFPKPSTAHIY